MSNSNVTPRSYLELGEKLGRFVGQIADYAMEEVLIEYHGELVNYGTRPVMISILKGLLTPFVGDTVNYVNAPVMAKERGIRIIESTSATHEDFANLIAITARSKMEQNTIAGTLFGRKELRIVRLNDFIIEAIPDGYILLVKNYDKPGVIGSIGMAMGSRDINIATMQFGRDRMGGNAISLLHLDAPLPPGMLGEILRLPNIISVRQIFQSRIPSFPTSCEDWSVMMSEILIAGEVGTVNVTTLPETPEEKARQLPDPATYHLLCALPEIEDKYDSGLIKSGQTMHFEEVMSPVLFVVKMGPDCYKDPLRFPSGPSCKVGDFVLVRPNTGPRVKIHGQEFRIINDDSVEAVVQDPRGISRA